MKWTPPGEGYTCWRLEDDKFVYATIYIKQGVFHEIYYQKTQEVLKSVKEKIKEILEQNYVSTTTQNPAINAGTSV